MDPSSKSIRIRSFRRAWFNCQWWCGGASGGVLFQLIVEVGAVAVE